MARGRQKLSDQLRQAIETSGHTRYRISQATGISESALGKFFHGERGLRLDSLDKLADFLKLEVAMRRKKTRKNKK